MNNSQIPLVRLPQSTETALYLIREELKSRKLFQALHQVGLDDCYFQPHLDGLILRFLGLDTSDETFNRYHVIMDKHSRFIEASRESITKHALKVYHTLINLRTSSGPNPRN